MPYTLAKWALWLIAAGAIGLIVGWMLRGVRRASATPASEDELAELERLRVRVDETEKIANERERLRIELDDCRATAAANRAAGLSAVVAGGVSSPTAFMTTEPAPSNDGERARLTALVLNMKPQSAISAPACGTRTRRSPSCRVRSPRTRSALHRATQTWSMGPKCWARRCASTTSP